MGVHNKPKGNSGNPKDGFPRLARVSSSGKNIYVHAIRGPKNSRNKLECSISMLKARLTFFKNKKKQLLRSEIEIKFPMRNTSVVLYSIR